MTSRAVIGGEWSVWPQAVVRSAGFPARDVLLLASSGAAGAADGLVENDGPPDGGDSWHQVFDQAAIEVAGRIGRIAALPAFQEAVTWQNRAAAERALRPLATSASGGRRTSAVRAREDLVAGYWQRYCVKNESIGFFGPTAWASVAPGSPAAVRADPGPGLLASRQVFLELWGLDALARTLERDPRLRRSARPRRTPYLRIDPDGLVHRPQHPDVRITRPQAALLARCGGADTARELARRALRDGLWDDEAGVYEQLEALAGQRLVVWRFEVPVVPDPRAWLRHVLAAVDEPELRSAALDSLRRLEEARSRVAGAAGRPAALGSELRGLEDEFRAITGATPEELRAGARQGRALVYEDCRRDVRVEIGSAFLEALAPVGLLLTSARWLTFRVAALLSERLDPLYEGLRARSASGCVDLGSLWFESMQLVHAELPPLVDEVETEFQRRWAAALGLEAAGSRVRRRLADVERAVAVQFAAPHAGWTAARYHCPDVMIAAGDPRSLTPEHLHLVVGDVHHAINTVRHSCFVALHPEPAELLRCMDEDLPAPRLVPVPAKEAPPRLTPRLHPAPRRAGDVHLVLSACTVDAAACRTVNAGDVLVRRDEGGKLVLDAGDRRFDLIDAYSDSLAALLLNRGRIVGEVAHAPRITVDRVTLSRESWRFPESCLDFVHQRNEAGRYLAARRFWKASGMPRHVFLSSPLEDKPTFVDFDSPVLVRSLARTVRAWSRSGGGRHLTFTEMLPGLDECWLSDAAGRRYTSELRLAIFDLRAG